MLEALSQRFSPQLPSSLLSRGSDLGASGGGGGTDSPRPGRGSFRSGAAQPLASPARGVHHSASEPTTGGLHSGSAGGGGGGSGSHLPDVEQQ